MKNKILLAVSLLFISICGIAQTQFLFSPVVCKQGEIGKVYTFNPGRLPKFPGDDSLLQDYVTQHLMLPKADQRKMLFKSVKASFEVDTLGKIWNVKLINRDEKNAEAEQMVITMFCDMPDWIPGGTGDVENAESFNVCIRMMVEIKFRSPEEDPVFQPSLTFMRIPRGQIVKQIPGQEEALTLAEEMPDFRDGFMPFLKSNIKYPLIEKESGKQGTVYISFIVEKDGSVTNVDIAKDILDAPGLSTEAMRVISMMPKWKPGTMNGNPVRVKMIQPVRFVLQ